MFDWNDLRYFLAVAEGGSTLGAARRLRVSQTTVARRVAALEETLGAVLFERRASGYVLTPAGAALLDRARDVEKAAAAFADSAASLSRDVSGTVRLTTEEILANTLLGPILRELHERHPEIMIELDTTQELRDLGRGDADIALRSTASPQPAGIVGRRLCVDDWTVYCSRDYASHHGVPKSVEDLRRHPLVGGGGGHLWRAYEAWIHELGLDDQVAIHQSSSTGVLSAIRSGFGVGVLPCLVADDDPDLVRCMPPRRGNSRSLWLITHERVRHAPRVRVAIDFLYERLKARVRDLNIAL